MATIAPQLQSIPFESLAQLAVVAGTLVFVLMLVGLGAFAYRSLTGGIEWPDDQDEEEGGVTRNTGDDEWKYS